MISFLMLYVILHLDCMKATIQNPQEIRRKLREAAKSLYKIKAFKDVAELYQSGNESKLDELEIEEKYLKRGELVN